MLAVLGPIPAKPKVYIRAGKKNVCRYFQEKEKIFLLISLILKSYMAVGWSQQDHKKATLAAGK